MCPLVGFNISCRQIITKVPIKNDMKTVNDCPEIKKKYNTDKDPEKKV
jgi:hypothetical protein